MKGKIFLLLFALPFFGVGVWMAYSISSNLLEANAMRDWRPVEATLHNAGYESHSGDDSTTYEAYAVYNYSVDGLDYQATRVSISGGADNIGDYQQDIGRHLSSLMSRGETIQVYVNPGAPGDAIIDRSLRWGLLGFKAIFLLVFGGVGLGLIIFTVRAPAEKDPEAVEFQDAPWLANDDWVGNRIASSSKATMYFTWIFAGIWNLISAPLPFLVYKEFTEKNNAAALFGILFPVIGIGLLVWAIRRTMEWRRFGAAPVTLDPYPGSIGGQVGGSIDVNIPYDPSLRFSVTLVNIHSYMSGSGDDRSRRESALWQDTQVAHCLTAPKGSRLSFRFDVPEDLQAANAFRSTDSYHLWRLNVSAEMPGIDINRDYDIPVYATAQQSQSLPDFAIEQAKGEQRKVDLAEIQKLFTWRHDVNGRSLYFPMGRNIAGGMGGLLFGSIFAAIGWYLLVEEHQLFMGSIFGFVGALIALGALYAVSNSLEVTRYGGEVRATRRLLGFPISRKSMHSGEFVRFGKDATSKTQSGSKHQVRYAISAIDRNDNRMTVGEGFIGASQAATAASFISDAFGLIPANRDDSDLTLPVDDYDFLTAD